MLVKGTPIITDMHIGARNDDPAIRRQQAKFLDFFFDYLQKNEIKHVLHGGDLYERRKYINFQTQQFARKNFLERFEKLGIRLDIIPGNHDQYSRNTNEVLGLFELARSFPNVNIHVDPTEIMVGNQKVLMLPWICDSNMKATMEAIEKTTAKYCLGHLELYGFEMDKGNVCTHGMNAELFGKFHWVGTGHFHHRSSKGNIHYLGASGELTWHDYNDPRGFTMMNFETGFWHHVDNPYIIHRVLVYDDTTGEEILKQDFSIFEDCYVKVKIEHKANDYLFDLFMERVMKANPIKVTIMDSTIEILNEKANSEVSMNSVESTPMLINRYVDNLDLKKADKLKGLLGELYNEALSLETID